MKDVILPDDSNLIRVFSQQSLNIGKDAGKLMYRMGKAYLNNERRKMRHRVETLSKMNSDQERDSQANFIIELFRSREFMGIVNVGVATSGGVPGLMQIVEAGLTPEAREIVELERGIQGSLDEDFMFFVDDDGTVLPSSRRVPAYARKRDRWVDIRQATFEINSCLESLERVSEILSGHSGERAEDGRIASMDSDDVGMLIFLNTKSGDPLMTKDIFNQIQVTRNKFSIDDARNLLDEIEDTMLEEVIDMEGLDASGPDPMATLVDFAHRPLTEQVQRISEAVSPYHGKILWVSKDKSRITNVPQERGYSELKILKIGLHVVNVARLFQKRMREFLGEVVEETGSGS
jgi:hypothetical protein